MCRPTPRAPLLFPTFAPHLQISLDVIGLGEHAANADKIKVLVDASNTDENNSCVAAGAGRRRQWGMRHLAHHAVHRSYAPIPEGVPPSDALMSSSILTGVAGGAGGAGAGQFAQYGGVNPELDPELAMVRSHARPVASTVACLTNVPCHCVTDDCCVVGTSPPDHRGARFGSSRSCQQRRHHARTFHIGRRAAATCCPWPLIRRSPT